jgi:hypothetical protein
VDDWPIPGDNLTDGTYQIVSRQSEYTLEEHRPAAETSKTATGDAVASAAPPAAQPATTAAGGTARLVRYITLDNQKWKIAPVKGGFYSVVNAGTGDALGSAGAGAELAPYAGKDEQMWRLEQFPDGGYRVVNKATRKCLIASGMPGVTVGDFVRDDSHLWTITTP